MNFDFRFIVEFDWLNLILNPTILSVLVVLNYVVLKVSLIVLDVSFDVSFDVSLNISFNILKVILEVVLNTLIGRIEFRIKIVEYKVSISFD